MDKCAVMTAHHLLQEDRALHKCMYCGKPLDLSSWRSSFSQRRHYKVTECSCGKSHHVTIDINSSGHDTWIKQRFKDLEDKLK